MEIKSSTKHKDIPAVYLVGIGAVLVVVAIILGYIAAGKKIAPVSDTEVHIIKTGASGGANSPQSCPQAMTKARNPVSGETRIFDTPCDVPGSWVLLK